MTLSMTLSMAAGSCALPAGRPLVLGPPPPPAYVAPRYGSGGGGWVGGGTPAQTAEPWSFPMGGPLFALPVRV